MAKNTNPLIEIRFPLGGLNRQAGFSHQPPYTTPYCVNVRPYDIVNLSNANMHGMRQRGGARPGIAKAYAQRCETGPIQFLGFASVLSNSGAISNILLASAAGCLYQNVSGSMAKVTGYPHFNTTAQLQGTQVGQKYYITDTRPRNLQGTNGTIASNNRLSDPAVSDWTNLGAAIEEIDTTYDVVFISGNTAVEANIFPITSVTSGYIVFDGTMTNQTGDVVWQLGRVPKVFDPADPTAALKPLMDVLPVPRANYNVGTVSITNGEVTMSGGSWAGVPQASDASMLTLTIPNQSGIGTRDYLVAVNSLNTGAGTCTLNDTTSDADSSNVAYTLSWTSDYYGIPPLNCPLCCTYRGRLVLAGPGPIWYMSRVLNPNDWDYGYDPNDGARPVAGTSSATGGIPEPIIALMPHSDDYLIFGCASSLWILNGDPAYGGTITALSRDVGVVSATSWCSLPDASIVFLSRDGIYLLPPGGQSFPQAVSRNLLPAELLNVDSINNTITMCYDAVDRGIHLSITPTNGNAGTHYFLDWTIKGFWPMAYPSGVRPSAMVRYAPNASQPATTILGGMDGYLRKFSATATTDDGTAISSVICYGPFDVGGLGYYGQIVQIAADLDSNGQGVSWGIVAGETAQGSVQAAVTAGTAGAATWHGSWAAGDNHRDYPHAVGASMVIMLSGTYGWAVEQMQIETRKLGAKR